MGVPQKGKKRDTRSQVTYKGVDKETQTAVRKASKKSKMLIGVWVNRSLLEAAQVELGKESPPLPLDINKEMKVQRELLERLSSEIQSLKNKPTLFQRLRRGTPK